MGVRSGRRAAVVAALALALVLVVGFSLSACGSAASSGAASTAGGKSADGRNGAKPAPAISGVTLDGKTISLDHYRGKPLLVVYMTPT